MNEQLKDYFYFSRGEKNGIIVLLVLLVAAISIPYLSSLFDNEKTEFNHEFEHEIALFEQSLVENEKPEHNNRLNQYIIERYDSLDLFYFNPNTTTKENFKKLGLTEKQIKTLFNYISKGGKFSIKDDFRKIYGIRQQQYQILKPFLLLPDSKPNSEPYNKNYGYADNSSQTTDSLFVFDPNTTTNFEFKKLGLSEKQIKTIQNYINKVGKFKTKNDFKKVYGISNELFNQLEPYIFIKTETPNENSRPAIIIELNTATVSNLIEIKGIGEYTAKEIIKYREKLGGFTNKLQLIEIKAIKPESFDNFKATLSVNKSIIRKLSLNFSEFEDFVSHPYLNYYQSKEIVKFRSVNGPYQDKQQLLNNKILLKGTYSKIAPYLSLN